MTTERIDGFVSVECCCPRPSNVSSLCVNVGAAILIGLRTQTGLTSCVSSGFPISISRGHCSPSTSIKKDLCVLTCICLSIMMVPLIKTKLL